MFVEVHEKRTVAPSPEYPHLSHIYRKKQKDLYFLLYYELFKSTIMNIRQ